MASENRKWIVKDDVGHIYGPFDLNKLRDLLGKGILTGEEEAAQYPAGDWRPMSAEAEIYNVILDSLSAEQIKTQGIKPPPQPKPQLNLVSPPPQGEDALKTEILTKIKTKVTKIMSPDPSPSEMPTVTQTKKRGPLVGSHEAIELTDTRTLSGTSGLKANIIPLILVILAIFLFYFGTHLKTTVASGGTISLLAPHIKGSAGSASRAEDLYRAGVSFFYKDTILNYLQAEEKFVEAIEEDQSHSKALQMLILTDLELWPLTKQDSNDQTVLQNLLQMISKADVAGTRREVAAPAVDIALGHEATAASQIDSALVKNPADGFLYALKGQIYHDTSDYAQSISYFEKAAALLPNWVKPSYYLGLNYSKEGLGAQAQQNLVQALKINPSHPGARLELGVVESRYFNHDEKAQGFLTVALDGQERLSPFIESRGRIALASIFLRSGDMANAKKQTLLAAQLSPTDTDVEDLLTKLGEKKASANVSGASQSREHMALGDQYMRTANYLGAQAQYKSAFAANPQNARAAMKVAEALWKLHQSGEAVEYLQKSVGADPRFIEGYVLMADYKGQRFDFDGATKALDAALKKNPKNYEIFRGYAELEYRRGNLSASEVNLQKA